MKTYRKATGNDDAVKVAQGEIGGITCVVAALDFSFMGGSMGTAVGEGIVKAAEMALKGNYPLITVAASGGARMQEGILSLMQMARTTAAINMVKEKGLPFISVLTDPTTGGVSASFAMLGDIHIAEKGCVIGFAGARVIEQTIRENFRTVSARRISERTRYGRHRLHSRRIENELVKVISILTHNKPRLNTPLLDNK